MVLFKSLLIFTRYPGKFVIYLCSKCASEISLKGCITLALQPIPLSQWQSGHTQQRGGANHRAIYQMRLGLTVIIFCAPSPDIGSPGLE